MPVFVTDRSASPGLLHGVPGALFARDTGALHLLAARALAVAARPVRGCEGEGVSHERGPRPAHDP